jgi:hypothetical protein
LLEPSKTATSKKDLKEKLSFHSLLPDECGHLYCYFRLESELSSIIDYDELEMGDKVAKGGFGTVYKASWRGNTVAVKKLNVQELVEEEKDMVLREIKLMRYMHLQ